MREIRGLEYNLDVLNYCVKNLSEYLGVKNGEEIIFELFSSIYSKTLSNKLALKYYTERVKIILKRDGI